LESIRGLLLASAEGIGLQAADIPMMPPLNRALIRVSEVLRKTSHFLPLLRYGADSVYVESVRTAVD
jgi:hypothetical protein